VTISGVALIVALPEVTICGPLGKELDLVSNGNELTDIIAKNIIELSFTRPPAHN